MKKFAIVLGAAALAAGIVPAAAMAEDAATAAGELKRVFPPTFRTRSRSSYPSAAIPSRMPFSTISTSAAGW